MLAPDGDLLCYTDTTRVKWYLKKGLGEIVSENPMVIKLKFEPTARGRGELNELGIDRDLYMKYYRENQCFVCGKKENLLKYHVVPVLYRQHFPLEMKFKRSHDVILLCTRCQEKANKESDIYKIDLAERYKIPLV